MIAALFVQTRGVYAGQPGVDLWDQERDARQYTGPYPVVAHPPCARWGNYWFGSPSSPIRLKKGDDGGCFISALLAVRTYGGVLEHPRCSHAWAAFGINTPPSEGGWVPAGGRDGWTCCVEQGHYGHPSRKATWLYSVGPEPEPLEWGPSTPENPRVVEVLSHRQRAATPPRFRDLLLKIARR